MYRLCREHVESIVGGNGRAGALHTAISCGMVDEGVVEWTVSGPGQAVFLALPRPFLPLSSIHQPIVLFRENGLGSPCEDRCKYSLACLGGEQKGMKTLHKQ